MEIRKAQWYSFQSTPSAWRETLQCYFRFLEVLNFNPLPPHGGRHREQFQQMISDSISIHSLRMEGDTHYRQSRRRSDYFNPLPPHGGRQTMWDSVQSRLRISIHSLRMEGDTVGISLTQKLCISIHSLRMEGDILLPFLYTLHSSFQSTPSAWRETDR